jgi:hypothetical protein
MHLDDAVVGDGGRLDLEHAAAEVERLLREPAPRQLAMTCEGCRVVGGVEHPRGGVGKTLLPRAPT